MLIVEATKITDGMIAVGTTIAEPAAGETEWAEGVAYDVGDVRIRKTTHRVYKCADNHTSSSGLKPEGTPDKWVDIGPTQRFAPFDEYVSTAAQDEGAITFVLEPGYFNTIALYGLVGDNYLIEVRDQPLGAVIWSRSGSLTEDPAGWYEYLFMYHHLEKFDRLFFTNIPIRPSAEVTITITAGAAEPVAIGMIQIGDLQQLVPGEAQFGGVQYGAKAEPVTYSYIRTADDGTTKIVRRHSATDLRCSVILPRRYADRAVALLQKRLDQPLAWIATENERAPNYRGLMAFGIATSSSVSYDSFNIATIELNIKGMI